MIVSAGPVSAVALPPLLPGTIEPASSPLYVFPKAVYCPPTWTERRALTWLDWYVRSGLSKSIHSCENHYNNDTNFGNEFGKSHHLIV